MSTRQVNKGYTAEFKQKVIETMHEEKLSYKETARRFEVCSHDNIERWEEIYQLYGAEGLGLERRGRKLKESSALPEGTGKDLLRQLERLRAEVDYLKNLNALVSKRVQRERSHK